MFGDAPVLVSSSTGPITINATGNVDVDNLPLGRPGSTHQGIKLVGSPAGGEDEAGGSDYDSTARINVYMYQRAEATSYAELLRSFQMRSNAKGILAWYFPRTGYDSGGVPLGSNWDPKAWLVAHAASNDDPTNFHNHFSIELPDSSGDVQTRLEFPFGPQGVGVDQTIRGLNHTNIKTNLADLTVRASGSTSYPGGKLGVLRVAGGNYEKIIEYSRDAETGSDGAIRFRLVVNATTESGSNSGSDFAIRRHADDGTLLGTGLFIERKTGNLAAGQANSEPSRVAAIWNTNNHHGFYAKPSVSLAPGGGSAFAAVTQATSDKLIDSKVGTETTGRFSVQADGKHEWGTGSATRDTNLYRDLADRLRTDDDLHISLNTRVGLVGGAAPTGGGGVGVIAIANAATVPSTNPSAGVVYVEGGALKYRGSSGTVTTLAPA